MNEELEKILNHWFMRLQLDKEFDELSKEIQVMIDPQRSIDNKLR